MQLPNLAGSLAQRLGATGFRLPWKSLVILAALAVLVLFGDILLPLLLEGLHVLMEFVELGLERLLEHAFGLTPRKAQMVIAYSALVLLAYGSVVLARKTYAAWLRLSAASVAFWAGCKAKWAEGGWRLAAVAVGVVGVALLLFM